MTFTELWHRHINTWDDKRTLAFVREQWAREARDAEYWRKRLQDMTEDKDRYANAACGWAMYAGMLEKP